MKVMGKHKQLAICIAAALCAASTGFAATSHWNDASATPQAETQTAVGTADWQQWKTAWEKIRTDYEQVSMAPGKDSSCLNFGWYSREQAEKAEVRIAKTQDMKAAKTFRGTSQAGTVIDGTTYFTNKVEVSGLQSGQSYWYQVKLDGKWQQAHEVKTGNPDDFSFMYVGDPQIGASSGQTSAEGNKQDGELAARNDAYNWNKTLNSALAQHPEINFLVSPGDQINEPAAKQDAEKIKLQETQYAGYLSAAALHSLPEASSIGNHDSMTRGYAFRYMSIFPQLFIQKRL